MRPWVLTRLSTWDARRCVGYRFAYAVMNTGERKLYMRLFRDAADREYFIRVTRIASNVVARGFITFKQAPPEPRP